ncbi:MAG: succinate dehydrogenase, cytochrome b556 subunit [Methanobacteriota archaeon]|nr:MAG: succinate dehydrogenase, cytochrome b556 subunit [Euryarchaeota archaeon]
MVKHSGIPYYTKRIAKASLETGTFAHLLHRITGLLLVVYLFLHMGVISFTYLNGQTFDDLMATFSSPLFLVLDLVLFAGAMIHGMNGMRIMLFDMGLFTRRQKLIFWVMMAIAAIAVLAAAYLLGTLEGWW